MQALILAAGMGKRLGEFTHDNTKCMLEVHGEKLIDRTLNSLASLGIRKVIMVVGYKAKNLTEYLISKYSNDQFQFEFVINERYAETNNIYSLYLAKDSFVKDDTIILESDLIFDGDILRTLIDDKHKNLAVVDKYDTWMDGTTVTLGADLKIMELIEKRDFKTSMSETYYKTVNIYKFSKEFINDEYMPFLSAFIRAYGENEYYETVLKAIVYLQRSDLSALVLNGQKWYEIDNSDDYAAAGKLFIDAK